MEKLIVANLKMNGTNAEIEELLNQYSSSIKNRNIKVVMCLPFPYLNKFNHSQLSLGAQNVSNHQIGAYTGEVSAEMLADFKVEFCIVGHADRRRYNAENTMQCYEKILQLLNNNITPILCVGENEKQRQEGLTLKTIKKQVSGALKRLEPEQIEKVVIAYEPVWAINENVMVNTDEINNIAIEIKNIVAKLTKTQFNFVKNPIIYGGSANLNNAHDILSKKFINGLLVGRISLNTSNFIEMCNKI